MSTHRLQQLQRASLVRARERPQDSTALAPRPGAHRHAWHPPPPPPSPPALTDEEKRSRLHYLRVAKTGSSAALRYFQLTKCSRRVHFHENHMDMRVPFPQRSVVVLCEPCDRAGSMLSHLLGLYPASPNRTASRYWSRDYNHSLLLPAAQPQDLSARAGRIRGRLRHIPHSRGRAPPCRRVLRAEPLRRPAHPGTAPRVHAVGGVPIPVWVATVGRPMLSIPLPPSLTTVRVARR